MKENTNKKSLRSFLDTLSSQGIYCFTSKDYQHETSISEIGAKKAIIRAIKRKEVATPYKGFHVIVPPEYRSLGCLPAELFIDHLMKFLNEEYYIGLLSASSYHGASHQAPQELQVITTKKRPPLSAGRIRITFTTKKDLTGVSVFKKKTNAGYINVSTPEATSIDLVTYIKRSGGLDNVATVLKELSEALDSTRLVNEITKSKIIDNSIVQRLGYLLNFVGSIDKTHGIAEYIRNIEPRYVKLDPKNPSCKLRDTQWKVIINEKLEPDI